MRPLITPFILHSSTAPEKAEVKVFKASGEIHLLISQLIKFLLGSFDILACNTFFFFFFFAQEQSKEADPQEIRSGTYLLSLNHRVLSQG